jgi:hypothetical protein
MLSRDQVDHFREQGTVVLPRRVPVAAPASIRSAAPAIFDRLAAGKEPSRC